VGEKGKKDVPCEKTARRLAERWRVRCFLGCAPLLVLEGDHVLTVRGCQRILSYTTEDILLLAGGRGVRVEGRRLLCRSFSAGAITVVGEILRLSYETPWEKGGEL
jgi:hypothetical protein